MLLASGRNFVAGKWLYRYRDLFGGPTASHTNYCFDPHKVFLSLDSSPANFLECIEGKCTVLFLVKDEQFKPFRHLDHTFYCTEMCNREKTKLLALPEALVKSTIDFVKQNAVMLEKPKV